MYVQTKQDNILEFSYISFQIMLKVEPTSFNVYLKKHQLISLFRVYFLGSFIIY